MVEGTEHSGITLDALGDWRSEQGCGSWRADDIGREVLVMGWVDVRRDHGGIVFVDLRDRTGILQIVLDPDDSPDAHRRAHALRSEWVVAARGRITARPAETINNDIPTGQIELRVLELRVLSTAHVLPFPLDDAHETNELLRARYRYLDLRRPRMLHNLQARHRATSAIRRLLDEETFIEVETPVLTRSTPEGARDYLVPSRVTPGSVYALPQSPQLFKQILMVAGLGRYYQVVRCFRDEDLRADRQPEFTQVDLEMSFVGVDDIMAVTERILVAGATAIGAEVPTTPFLRMSYAEATRRFGTDRPDTRFGLELVDLSIIMGTSQSKILAEAVAKGGMVGGIVVEDGSRFSRRELDELVEWSRTVGAKGLAWIRSTPDGWQSPLAKFI